MNGTTVAYTDTVGNIPIVWTLAGRGDFNGDGVSDLLWRDGSGNTAIWLMAAGNGHVMSTGSIGNIPTTWSLVQIGDYDGDTKSDILWRDTSGDTAI
jgi:serralysin